MLQLWYLEKPLRMKRSRIHVEAHWGIFDKVQTAEPNLYQMLWLFPQPSKEYSLTKIETNPI